MTWFKALLAAAALALCSVTAQAQAPMVARVVAACGTVPVAYPAGSNSQVVMDVNGNFCTNASGGGGGGGTSSTFGAAFPSTGTAAGVSDGTNMVALRIGPAGTAASTVLTVQGIASMTPLLATLSAETTKVIGTVNQGTSPWVVSLASTTITGTVGVTQSTSPWVVSNGGTFATQSAVTAASGSFSSGAFVSGSIASGALAAGSMVDLLTMRGTKAPGTAATNSLLAGGVYTSAGITLTDGQQAALQFSSTGSLLVQGIGVAQGSTTSGQTISPIGCRTLTAAPTDTTAQTNIPWCRTGGTLAVDLASINGTATVNGGVAGSQSIGGTVATNVAITANPLNLGAQAVSSENTAVTTARQVQLVADLVGKLIVLPYANPENFVTGTTAAMTGTTTTSLIAAPASGLRNYLTHLICTNSHATVGTFVLVQDGSGGTTIYEGYAAAVGGGFSITLPTPLRQPTTATALFVADVTTGANVICSGSGYKGA